MSDELYFTSEYESDLFYERYQDPGNADEVTWEQLFTRVTTTIAPTTELALKFYNMIAGADVIPSSPQLWNYGASRRFPRNGSSCFTGKMGDTLKDFRQADSDAEDVYVASGGFGLLLDDVRPRMTKILHCSEGAMGSMCEGGPALRTEGTTGYITGSGRARGALMMQQSLWHPDIIEFIVSKAPISLGWLDDWDTNARAMIGDDVTPSIDSVLLRYSAKYVFNKQWPMLDPSLDTTRAMVEAGVLKADDQGRYVPQVMDWATGEWREANRDWELPLQNCNMSVRAPDCFYESVDEDRPWVFHWFSPTPPKDDEAPWTLSDYHGELKEYEDGNMFVVSDDMSTVEKVDFTEYDGTDYRYGQAITTWEGMRARMAPNKNQWRDTKYARFYRKRLMPAIEHLSGTIMARQVWQLLIDNAWGHADPGIVNSDTYERFQPVDSAIYGPRLSNPCSEYVNSGGGSCNLASVNLRKAIEQVESVQLFNASEQWRSTGLDAWCAVRGSMVMASYLGEVESMARDAIEYISYASKHNVAPVDYIDTMTRDHFRTVGVGFMGLAEALMTMHITYGSDCAQKFTAATMSEIALTCWEGSFKLASEGWPKPLGWNQDKMLKIFSARLDNAHTYDLPEQHLIRWRQLITRVAGGEYATHTCVTSVAPTGTIAMIAGWLMSREASNGVNRSVAVSNGVEPVFAQDVGRQDNSGEVEVHHDMWVKAEHAGKPWMVTANGLSMEAHVRMQAAACAFCCMSVSKTINAPEDATAEMVADAYRLAWELGVPGTSIYRNNSKPMQVLSVLECPSGECSAEPDLATPA